MDVEQLMKLIDKVSESDLTGFKYEENGIKLQLNKKENLVMGTTAPMQAVTPEAVKVTFFIGLFCSDRLMDKSIFHAFDTSNKFYSACCSKQEADEECDLNYAIESPVEKEIKAAMSNSLGFGGHNATILIQKYEA